MQSRCDGDVWSAQLSSLGPCASVANMVLLLLFNPRQASAHVNKTSATAAKAPGYSKTMTPSKTSRHSTKQAALEHQQTALKAQKAAYEAQLAALRTKLEGLKAAALQDKESALQDQQEVFEIDLFVALEEQAEEYADMCTKLEGVKAALEKEQVRGAGQYQRTPEFMCCTRWLSTA